MGTTCVVILTSLECALYHDHHQLWSSREDADHRSDPCRTGCDIGKSSLHLPICDQCDRKRLIHLFSVWSQKLQSGTGGYPDRLGYDHLDDVSALVIAQGVISDAGTLSVVGEFCDSVDVECVEDELRGVVSYKF